MVLFSGNGATSAIELLIDCLGVHDLATAATNQDDRPVVFVGPYEHHSNLLPWRESGCEVVVIPECPKTRDVDMSILEEHLVNPKYSAPGRLKMGTFAAASNVNGKVSDVDKIAATLHKHGALAFFDYATGASYLPMDMNPSPLKSGYEDPVLVSKDAVFISPHKMIGGIGGPGILVVKKSLVSQVNPPNRSGGGTVFYVTNTHHRFLSNRIERYEGGTPNVVGICRAGLAFLYMRKVHGRYSSTVQGGDVNVGNQLAKASVPLTVIDYEYNTYKIVVSRLRRTAPNLIMLGADNDEKRGPNHLPIFSFLIKAGRRFLHYNFVCALLNDLFGIQSRGGCQCSGPYSQRLLGLTKQENSSEVPNDINCAIEYALVHYKERAELLRPGYSRLSLPFKGITSAEVEYVLKAIEWIAKNGWMMMCQYRCNHRTGEWRHFSRQGKPLGRTERKWLSHYDMKEITAESQVSTSELLSSEKSRDNLLGDALNNADAQLMRARTNPTHTSKAMTMGDENGILGTDDALEDLRWYVYPRECAKAMKEGSDTIPDTFSDKILGPIRPIGLFTEEAEVLISSRISYPTAVIASKMTSSIEINDVVESTVNKVDLDSSGLIFFRDGETHSGEATIEDIEAGFNDGELSGSCEIFSSQENEWLSIESFLSSRKKAKNQEIAKATNTDAVTLRHLLHEEKGIIAGAFKEDDKESTPLLQRKVPLPSNGNSKAEMKKPSRDSSTWGKPSATAPAAHSMELDSPGKKEPNIPVKPKPPKRDKKGRIRPPPKMMRWCTQAMLQWNMIGEGDRLMLGLSGGKDSLSLLHCLLEFQKKLPIKFDIEVCTIDPMTPSFDPSPLIPYVESLGLKYHYIRDDIVARANTSGKDGKVVSSLCSFCARMKRGILYSTARKANCNKLVLAQHLDDCGESMFMSIMHNGFLRTMKANYEINAGGISVIRPMVYCRESLMTEFAKAAKLPVINENCPACFEEPKERDRIKKLLSREEGLYPQLYDNVRRSLIPLMHDDMTSIIRFYVESALAKSRKDGKGKKRKNSKGTKDNMGEVAGAQLSAEGISMDLETNASDAKSLADASEEDLVAELARRKAKRFRLFGASKQNGRTNGGEDSSSTAPKSVPLCKLRSGKCEMFE